MEAKTNKKWFPRASFCSNHPSLYKETTDTPELNIMYLDQDNDAEF